MATAVTHDRAMEGEGGREIYVRRKKMVERSFAGAKQLHGHRYARMRGIARVLAQCLLAATAQNLKKIALLFRVCGPELPAEPTCAVVRLSESAEALRRCY